MLLGLIPITKLRKIIEVITFNEKMTYLRERLPVEKAKKYRK